MNRVLLAVVLLVLTFSACKKDPILVTGNDAPYYGQIPSVLIENYVNRLFIDLIGREPLDTEMSKEAAALKATNLSKSSREDLINKLQSSTAFVEGDTSYARAYYYWLYESAKARTIEGASELEIGEFYGQALSDSSRAAMAGDTAAVAEATLRVKALRKLLAGKGFKPGDPIYIDTIFRLMIDNDVYDFINMNSFNFINATFDNLYYRFPTTDEFTRAYDMVELELANSLWGMAGSNKQEYIDLVIRAREFYEGVVRWQYLFLMARQPNSQEVSFHMNYFYSGKDFKRLQRDIMLTDEYANLD